MGNVWSGVEPSDLFHSAFAKALRLSPAAQREFISSIEDVMSKHVISVAADTSIIAVARVMMEKKFGCLPVAQGEPPRAIGCAISRNGRMMKPLSWSISHVEVLLA